MITNDITQPLYVYSGTKFQLFWSDKSTCVLCDLNSHEALKLREVLDELQIEAVPLQGVSRRYVSVCGVHVCMCVCVCVYECVCVYVSACMSMWVCEGWKGGIGISYNMSLTITFTYYITSHGMVHISHGCHMTLLHVT